MNFLVDRGGGGTNSEEGEESFFLDSDQIESEDSTTMGRGRLV